MSNYNSANEYLEATYGVGSSVSSIDEASGMVLVKQGSKRFSIPKLEIMESNNLTSLMQDKSNKGNLVNAGTLGHMEHKQTNQGHKRIEDMTIAEKTNFANSMGRHNGEMIDNLNRAEKAGLSGDGATNFAADLYSMPKAVKALDSEAQHDMKMAEHAKNSGQTNVLGNG